MFAVGLAIALCVGMVLWGRPEAKNLNWLQYSLGLGLGLMVFSLVVLAWRWLP